jgi:hypothetical protein
MSTYYFNIISASMKILDEEGSDLPDLQSAHKEALMDARTLMSDAVLDGRDISDRSIEICGKYGQVLLVVPFRAAIAPEGSSRPD